MGDTQSSVKSYHVDAHFTIPGTNDVFGSCHSITVTCLVANPTIEDIDTQVIRQLPQWAERGDRTYYLAHYKSLKQTLLPMSAQLPDNRKWINLRVGKGANRMYCP
jgi:hypothetical protein